MSIERAREWLRTKGFEERVQEFECSSATVELAAQAVGCEPARIAKSLSFKVGEQPIIIITAGDRKIDNPKYKEKFAAKAKMLKPEEVVELIGHSVGGVCPFGIKEGVTVYLDESLKRFETVYPACGSSNSAVRLSIGELEICSGYQDWVDVCKGME